MKFWGQVEAPIELFIAVIILAMSMAIVFGIMRNTNEAKCIADLKHQTILLQEAIQGLLQGSPPTTRTIIFNMQSCGDTQIEGIRFVYYANKKYCGLCKKFYGGCWKIEPLAYDKYIGYTEILDSTVCLDVPSNIYIEEDSGNCRDLSENPCPKNPRHSVSPYSVDLGSGSILLDCKTYVPEPNRENKWITLGKEGSENTYAIILRKDVTTSVSSSSGTISIENPSIKICAIPYSELIRTSPSP